MGSPTDVALQVVGVGAATAIGRDWVSSCAAQRAGIAGFVAHPGVEDSVGEPVRVAAAPWLSWRLDGVQRLEILLEDAVRESLIPLDAAPPGLRIGLVLALPAARPGLPAGLADAMTDRLLARLPTALQPLGACASGHAAGFRAFAVADAALAEGRLDACVVAAADSWLEPETLAWLESSGRLHGAGAMNNAWGRIPGEAGAALLLARPDIVRRTGWRPFGALASIGIGHETRLGADEVCIGSGLTTAWATALRALPAGRRVDDVFCDMNGERDRANEFAFSALRFADRLRAATDFIAPADTWGDVGAASGPLGVAAALMAGLKHYGAGPWALAWASSDGGERGAALIDRRPTPGL